MPPVQPAVKSRCGIAVVTLLLAVALPGVAWAGGSDSIVIKLGDTAVTRGDVDERFEVAVRLLARRQGVALADQDPALIEQLRQQYLDKHATELVLLQEARRRQLDVSDLQLDATLAELFATPAEEDAFLADTSLDDTLKVELLRQVLREERTIELVTEHMLQEIKIPPGDVITLHHDIKDTLATPEEVCVRHIQSESAEAAREILAELQRGGDFAELAKTRSTDAASAAAGGDLGCFERSRTTTRSDFEKAAFAADENELTGPVESRFGHHILVVYEHILPRAPTLNEAYAEIERELALEQLPQRIQALVSSSDVRTYPDKFTLAAD